MDIETSSVYRNLEAKFKIAGMEACDLIFVLLWACLMDTILGHTELRTFAVFIFPFCVGLVLYLGKRGKPDQYLQHFIRYHCSPRYYSAGAQAQDQNQRKRGITDERA